MLCFSRRTSCTCPGFLLRSSLSRVYFFLSSDLFPPWQLKNLTDLPNFPSTSISLSWLSHLILFPLKDISTKAWRPSLRVFWLFTPCVLSGVKWWVILKVPLWGLFFLYTAITLIILILYKMCCFIGYTRSFWKPYWKHKFSEDFCLLAQQATRWQQGTSCVLQHRLPCLGTPVFAWQFDLCSFLEMIIWVLELLARLTHPIIFCQPTCLHGMARLGPREVPPYPIPSEQRG